MCSYPVKFEYIVVDSWSSLFMGKFSIKMHKEFQSSAILPYSSHLEASSNVDAIGNFQASTVDWNARRRIRPRQIEATWGHCGPLHKPWKDIAMEKELRGGMDSHRNIAKWPYVISCTMWYNVIVHWSCSNCCSDGGTSSDIMIDKAWGSQSKAVHWVVLEMWEEMRRGWPQLNIFFYLFLMFTAHYHQLQD